jgi:hypothetical protein
MDPRYPTGKFQVDPNFTAEKRQAAIAAIGRFPAELKQALAAAKLDATYREGGWTARQVVHHIADSHMNAFIRIRLALTENNPTIKPYDEAAWAKLADTSTEDPALSVQLLEGLHKRWHALLMALPESAFARTAVHPDHGQVTIDWFLQLYAWHGRHHIGHLKLTAKG